ncbi:uncharacterized protein AB675_8593 [Cyphellophora attinorum]|uniref:Uncharacterized protein n=1 Tax=Cyphellophora attinorum TaxID=1664694 RepID=A0A0N1HF37_9EURO|nr:uncharacterized protein AB675_8593 [Phialophora attinorum]KPI44247.1 hypothetical protein AB675_8593 [Phialophora attinorum]
MPSSTTRLIFSISLLSSLITAQEVTPSPSAAAPVDWATVVTWPAGCESWANPCPAGAKTSGVAPTPAAEAPATWSSDPNYTNGFTSYLTETDSNGVITGMPPKATSAGGQASVLSDQSSWLSAYGSTTLSTQTTSEESSAASATSSQSGSFVIATSTATSTPYQGAANTIVVRTGAVMGLVGGVAALLL